MPLLVPPPAPTLTATSSPPGTQDGLLEQQGLLGVLELQIDEFRSATDMDCSVCIEVAFGARAPQGALASAVVQIFREALANIARHADAHRVSIDVRLDPGRLDISVVDDGRGADPLALERLHSRGVPGMRKRAQDLGGSLTIATAPAAGARVDLSVPLRDAFERSEQPISPRPGC